MLFLRRHLLSFSTAVAVFSCSAVSAAFGQSSGHLTLQDLLSTNPITETALSPDGKTVAFTRESQVLLMPAEGGWPVQLTTTNGGKSGVSWSPDGNGFAQPAHRVDAWEKQLAFLQHYINPKFGTTSTSTEEVVFPGVSENPPSRTS